MYLAPAQLFVSSHPFILRFMCTCLYPRIPTSSSYHKVYVTLFASLILISLGLFVLACNLVSSHPHILRFMYSSYLLACSHPHILISLGLCVLTLNLVLSSHPLILRFMYSVCFLLSSHTHILISLGSFVTLGACWYSCILTS